MIQVSLATIQAIVLGVAGKDEHESRRLVMETEWPQIREGMNDDEVRGVMVANFEKAVNILKGGG